MKSIALALFVSCVGHATAAQQLDVEFEILEDAEAAGCAGSYVAGLDPNGDGFLAVRSGPGSNYAMIDKLRNGDSVRTCAGSGPWVGVYYGQPRRVGWTHGKWLVDGAG